MIIPHSHVVFTARHCTGSSTVTGYPQSRVTYVNWGGQASLLQVMPLKTSVIGELSTDANKSSFASLVVLTLWSPEDLNRLLLLLRHVVKLIHHGRRHCHTVPDDLPTWSDQVVSLFRNRHCVSQCKANTKKL